MPLTRDRMPSTLEIREQYGHRTIGRGKWLTGECPFHGGSDSFRINTESQGWVCMSCGAKGGDALAYVMQLDGMSFVDAAKQLGCWEDAPDDRRPRNPRPAGLSAGDALHVLREEARLVGVAAAMLSAGQPLGDGERSRIAQAAGRINLISGGLDAQA